MMELTKITLTSGATYIVNHTPEDVYQRVTHSDGKPKNHIHLFTLENGSEMYINATYILSIEKVRSHNREETIRDDMTENAEDRNRVEANVKAAKEFKEDLDGNME
ncbi:hypothetical protein SAMN04488100_11172 [Alkalibacterium putridalgicola]|uniref:Uncharacterized protein n=2 Tax=Alkalibacterium putridalgicola TaxID=426703 RepID=A0A1H7TAR1_9LACT|nr:hypothetical protein APU01nite_13250 [Alkalibacterium putridalgicola]SEL81952.1 hypothetical protein SAMN04488100_11172 [Alkalibacterium putridalgicola]